MQLWKGWMLMRSSLRALSGHRVRVAATSRARSGSPVTYLLQAEPSFAKTVSAAQILAKRHLPLRAAKAVVERLLEKQDVTIEIPQVENTKSFETELEELGIKAIRHDAIAEANSGREKVDEGQKAALATGDRRTSSSS
jgi:hypothetical protein